MDATLAVRPPATIRADWGRLGKWARRLSVAAIVLVGATFLVRDAGTVGRAVASLVHANPPLVLLTGILAAFTYLGAAIAITAASGHDLPLGRTTATQLAAACTNRIAPAGLGGMATNLRYLEHDGARRGEAIAAIGLASTASFLVHVILTSLVLVLVGVPGGGFPKLPVSWPTALLVLIGAALVARVGFRHLPDRVRESAREGWMSIVRVSSSPRRLGLLVVGTLMVTLGHGLAFVTAAAALGINVSAVALLAVFLTGSAVSAIAPKPGGLGPLEAALAAGLTSLGAAIGPAVAAVLVFRLITYWLPVLPGAIALKTLRREPLQASPRDLAGSTQNNPTTSTGSTYAPNTHQPGSSVCGGAARSPCGDAHEASNRNERDRRENPEPLASAGFECQREVARDKLPSDARLNRARLAPKALRASRPART